MRAAVPYSLRTTRPRTRAVERLARRTTSRGLDGVLADLDRTGRPCAVPGEAAGDGFAWEPRDAGDPGWFPQGIACLRGGAVLLVAWYAKRRGLRLPGSRISVVDRSDPSAPRYRHVRLVVPRRFFGVLRLGAVPVHAGGIAVSGDLLLVADTLVGVRVFRLADLTRVPGRAGAEDGWVLPQLVTCRMPLRAGDPRLRWSFLSVTGGPDGPQLVVGEYRRKGGGSPRLVRYPLDPGTGLPLAGDDGRAAPLDLHDAQPPRMQGVAVHGSTWFATASTGRGNAGDLHVGAPGAWHRHRGVLPTGPEDLDWSRPGEELWCASEWPGQRWVFPIAVDRWRRAG